MWVCHCHGVTDGQIRDVIAAGAGDEREIGRECGAGTRCGSCTDELRRLCDESGATARASSGRPFAGTSV